MKVDVSQVVKMKCIFSKLLFATIRINIVQLKTLYRRANYNYQETRVRFVFRVF